MDAEVMTPSLPSPLPLMMMSPPKGLQSAFQFSNLNKSSSNNSSTSSISDNVCSDDSFVGEEPQAAPFLRTVLIFDWDDTLFSSTWLSSNITNPFDEPLSPTSPEAQLFEQLEAAACNLLTAAMATGHVCIITNAENGWVQLAAQRFMPRLLPLLDLVNVVSARSTYEPFFPNNPTIWKVQAFYECVYNVLNSHNLIATSVGQAPINMISFGDSQVERHALHAVASHFGVHCTKSVKFMERPAIGQVIRQVELVTSYLDQVALYEGDLDLALIPPSPEATDSSFTCACFSEPAATTPLCQTV
eukprot:gnl/Hemi2/2349_TR834_c1_g1_i1.p1 gnl/Hemi2/2349_TR834_c1_g1~~gnl/Hemi2/2349_TR834_c1_g1_i1.p1  ORF type:complete len:302 (-),score=63.14 gnl/Hemi2/2349_TR834_c1_g1_i1:160-1065(-)